MQKKRNFKKKSKRAKYLLYIHSPKYYIYIIFVKYTFTRCVCEVVHELTETPLFGASSRRGWSHGGTPPGRPLTPRPTGNSPSLYASPRPGNQPETQRGQTRHHVYKSRGQRGRHWTHIKTEPGQMERHWIRSRGRGRGHGRWQILCTATERRCVWGWILIFDLIQTININFITK